MDSQFNPQSLNDHDVLAFGDATFKAGKFRQAAESCFGGSLGSGFSAELTRKGIRIDQALLAPNNSMDDYACWFGSGVDCEVLQVGATSWRKARVRIRVAVSFELEESEQPAAEIQPSPSPISQPVQSQPVQSQPVKPQPAKPQPAKPAAAVTNGSAERYKLPDELLEDLWG